MGLGSIVDNKGLYLSVAGGLIWDKRADKTHPAYGTQEYTKADKSTGVRAGARYPNLTGNVVGVVFKTHKEYGESINVTIEDGEDRYILAISTNNRYSQDLMKALLKADLSKPLFIKPHDFIGENGRPVRGISFKQDGAKLDLRVDSAPTKDADWFKSSPKKAIKRFFEDLNDWYVAEVEEKVCPQLSAKLPIEKTVVGEKTVEKVEEPTKEDVGEKLPSQIQMKKALKAYIKENYEGKTLPKLTKDQVVEWYKITLEEEELPFEEDEQDGEVGDLDSQLEALLPKAD